jgi:hypothetical protein
LISSRAQTAVCSRDDINNFCALPLNLTTSSLVDAARDWTRFLDSD